MNHSFWSVFQEPKLISELQIFPGFPKSRNNFQVDVSLEFVTYEIQKIEIEGIFPTAYFPQYPWKVFKKETCIQRKFVGFFRVLYTDSKNFFRLLLHYIILFYIVLYCIILYYIILYLLHLSLSLSLSPFCVKH